MLKEGIATISDLADQPALARPSAAANRSIASRLRRQKMETIGRLAGGVAHDINNLLTAIVLNSDVLAESIAEARLNALARTTRMCAERAGDLTRQLLAVVCDHQLLPRPMDVNVVIATLEPLLRRTLGEYIDLRIVADAREATVMLDPGQFESAVLNLALNARDAMPRGGRLVIRTRNGEPIAASRREAGTDNGLVVIAVSDDGTGMAPDLVIRALEPFFTTKADGAGTGLGLSTIKAFVRKAGGRLSIDSHSGAGTTVTLVLPTAAAEAPDLPLDEGWQTGPRGTESILLVEDDRIVRAHVEAALGDLGYYVRSAADPLGALDLFAGEHAFDLLLTDMVIPGGTSGGELAALLRRRWPELNVLYTSGYPVSGTMAAWLESEPHSGFLAKPFRRREIAKAVRVLLDGRDALQANSP